MVLIPLFKALLWLFSYFVINNCDLLDNACSFWLAFRQRLLMCSSNLKWLSMVTPKGFSELLFFNNRYIDVYGGRVTGW